MGAQDESGFEDVSQHLEVTEKSDPSLLPSPVSAQAPKPPRPRLSAAAIIPVWMILSSSVIIYNNYLYNTLQFPFPVFLVTWHLTFAVRPIHFTSCCLDD